MTTTTSRDPQLTVVGTSQPPPSYGLQALRDGTLASTCGGVIAGGFGVETTKSFITDDHSGQWAFLTGTLLGLALIALGAVLRTRNRRRTRIAIITTAPDAALGIPRADQLDQQAERHAQQTCAVTLKTAIPTAPGQRPTRPLIDALADETLAAIAMAERLTPDATQFHLIPTMPLHAGFWFGARLGHNHSRDIRIHQILTSTGEHTHFDATSLRSTDTKRTPLIIDTPLDIPGGDPTRAALALDLQGRGAAFFDNVTTVCRDNNIATLLPIRSPTDKLAQNAQTFDAAVTQICRAWQQTPLTPAARTGQHTIFLSGPLAIALALGARLAAADHGRWRAYSFNRTTATYEELPV